MLLTPKSSEAPRVARITKLMPTPLCLVLRPWLARMIPLPARVVSDLPTRMHAVRFMPGTRLPEGLALALGCGLVVVGLSACPEAPKTPRLVGAQHERWLMQRAENATKRDEERRGSSSLPQATHARQPITPHHGGTLSVSFAAELRTLDPHLAFDVLSMAGLRLLFDGLFEYDHHGHVVPGLAEAMPTISEDAKHYTVTLRDGVRFHHGRALEAEDVRWSLERMLDPALGSPGSTFFAALEGLEAYQQGNAAHLSGVKVEGTKTIHFTLKEPDQTFLHALAMTFAYPVPREHYGDPLDRGATEKTKGQSHRPGSEDGKVAGNEASGEVGTQEAPAHLADGKAEGRGSASPVRAEVAFAPVGTGPFTLESRERGVRLVFRKNPHYWRKGLPYLDRIEMQENISGQTAVMRFRNGDQHILGGASVADYVFFKQSKAWRPYISIKPGADIWGITMNCQMFPFDNVHLRRAVSYAIDRERWARLRPGRMRVTGQPIPPGIMGYNPELPDAQRYDLARAKEEMTRAGYPEGLPDPVTLFVHAGAGANFWGELVQSDLRHIGIEVRLRPVSFPVYIDQTGKPGIAQMTLSGWSQDFPDPADFLDVLFHSRAIHPENSENRSFYVNPTLDRLLDKARIEPDKETRRVLVEEAASLVARDAPWAFTNNTLSFFAVQPFVHNFEVHPVWHNELRFVWLDLPTQAWSDATIPSVEARAHGRHN